jgi:hypothetical protein
MSEKFDKEYEIEQFGEEATYLRNNGKVREVFALAAAGAIATIEEVGGDVYIVMKKEKFDNMLDQFAKKQDVELIITEAKGD